MLFAVTYQSVDEETSIGIWVYKDILIISDPNFCRCCTFNRCRETAGGGKKENKPCSMSGRPDGHRVNGKL